MNAEDLKTLIFDPVAKRVVGKAESLIHVGNLPRIGIEGWLKVEAVAALEGRAKARNKGPDLKIGDGFVELKAATDCNIDYIFRGLKDGAPCLFLGSSGDIDARLKKLAERCPIIACEKFRAGEREWVIGLIIPRDSGS